MADARRHGIESCDDGLDILRSVDTRHRDSTYCRGAAPCPWRNGYTACENSVSHMMLRMLVNKRYFRPVPRNLASGIHGDRHGVRHGDRTTAGKRARPRGLDPRPPPATRHTHMHTDPTSHHCTVKQPPPQLQSSDPPSAESIDERQRAHLRHHCGATPCVSHVI